MNRILEELSIIRQELETTRADMNSLRVELTRILNSQQESSEANKKKSMIIGSGSNVSPESWSNWNPIFSQTKIDGLR